MKTELKAKIIEVTDIYNGDFDQEREYTLLVYEFENGVIMVPGQTTSDWYFKDFSDYEPNSCDVFVRREDTGNVRVFTVEEIRESIKQSEAEFDYQVSSKVLELLH